MKSVNTSAYRFPEEDVQRDYEYGHQIALACVDTAVSYEQGTTIGSQQAEFIRRLLLAPANEYIGEFANQTRSESYGFADETIALVAKLPIAQRVKIHQELQQDTNYTRAARNLATYATGAFMGAREIDHVKIKALGRDSSTSFSNLLIEAHIEGLATVAASESYGFINRHRGFTHGIDIAGTATLPGKQTARDQAWLSHKVLAYGNLLEQTFGFFRICEDLERTGDIELRRQENDHLFNVTRNLQTYDVKPGIAPSPNPEHSIQEWLVSDYDGAVEHSLVSANTHPSKKPLAIFRGTTGKYLSDKVEVSKIDTAHNGYSVRYGTYDVDHTGDSEGFITNIVLMPDGDLQSLRGQSYYEVALENGALDEYETLRTEILCIYHDLTVPTLRPKLTKDYTETAPGVSPSDPITLRKLALKRVKYMADYEEDIKAEIEREGFGQRVMVGSEVVGHTRDLPTHYRASAEARRTYFEATGKLLPDFGKTYVKKHMRGVVEPEFKGYTMTFHEMRDSVAREFRKSRKAKGGRFTPPKSR